MLPMVFVQEFEDLLDGAAQVASQAEKVAEPAAVKKGKGSAAVPSSWKDCVRDGEDINSAKVVKQAKDRFRTATQREVRKSKKGTGPMLALCFAFVCCIHVLQ